MRATSVAAATAATLALVAGPAWAAAPPAATTTTKPRVAAKPATAAPAPGVPSAVPAPAQGGAWRLVGPVVTSVPGKLVHFFRTPLNPRQLGVVVTSASTQPIKLTWQSYCEFQSDDDETLEDFGAVTGTGLVTAYPHAFASATLCYVWVNAGAASGASTTGTVTVSAAVFAAG